MEFEAKRKSAKAQHRKELLDPLLDMQHYVETKKKSEGLTGKGSECESRRHSNPVQVIPQTISECKCSCFNECGYCFVSCKGSSSGCTSPE